MEDEYIIINKTAVHKRIEELEKQRNSEHKKGHDKSALRYENTILELKQILSQSTPLIPQIEKAYDAGLKSDMEYFIELPKHKNLRQNYITNLKLDI